MDPIVLFVATDKTVGDENFIRSLEKAQQPYLHVAFGEKWGG
jgi:hypothetical protein